ncbi:terpene synthase family protein [Streptomyces hesseae]|uniref:Terpene synthase n=1 Tax=Streptomyces hesseae TaxID=3075519 RepID=A0ABU2SJW2_9ACTN|nr:hypothetical protein [Streptomyces sp. DSM 40473]MDT0449073.1 hypothetical protein [Streptomyces sp. DSM 40473]
MPLTGWRLPALHYPFPPEIHPEAAAGEAHLLDWARREGLITDEREFAAFARARFGELVAREFPGATREGLELACEIYAWQFVFDDRYCDRPGADWDTAHLGLAALRVLTAVEESLAAGHAAAPGHTADPCARALVGICRRLATMGSRVQLERFLAAERMYLLGALAQSATVTTGRTPPVDEYITMRYYMCGTPVALAVLDAAYGFELPEEEYRDPDVQRLCRITAHVTGWANDVLSYGREATGPDEVALNLPTVLASARALTAQEALEASARMHNEEIAAYLRLEARVSARADHRLRCYLSGLRSMMRGFYDWGLATDRYRVGTHFSGAIRPLEVRP